VVHGTDADDQMIVWQRIWSAVQGAPSQHHLMADVNRLDLRVVQLGGRNELAHRGIDLLRLHFAREHLADETANPAIVVATDDRQGHLAAADCWPQRACQVNRDPPSAETNDARWLVHGCWSDFVRTAICRGSWKSRVLPFSPRSLNRWRKAF